MTLHSSCIDDQGQGPAVGNGPPFVGHDVEAARDAIVLTIMQLSEELRSSLRWKQSAGMVQHARRRIDSDLTIYFLTHAVLGNAATMKIGKVYCADTYRNGPTSLAKMLKSSS